MGSAVLSRLLTASGYAGGLYAAAILFAVLVGCVADDYRRADAHRILALLLFRAVGPDTLERLPRARRRGIENPGTGTDARSSRRPDRAQNRDRSK